MLATKRETFGPHLETTFQTFPGPLDMFNSFWTFGQTFAKSTKMFKNISGGAPNVQFPKQIYL
jgi:hypothetical protein